MRGEKAADFPELEDEKRVSWTVEYSTVTKTVTDPSGTTIAKLKTEIEMSKEFLDSLKKAKKEVVCKVKPRVTAQSKGVVSAYKGVFTSLDEAENSKKPICIVPSDDGNVYEIRNTEIGQFVTQTSNIVELPKVRAGFKPAFPPIPFSIIQNVISFFRNFMKDGNETEALVHIYWDKVNRQHHVYVPKQTVGKAKVNAVIAELDNRQYIHIADIHSHNSMPAKFSLIDDNDERATRVYIVIGMLNKFFPDISVRISNGGKYLPIPASLVIEEMDSTFPESWIKQVDIE